jgi:hypothetical protein
MVVSVVGGRGIRLSLTGEPLEEAEDEHGDVVLGLGLLVKRVLSLHEQLHHLDHFNRKGFGRYLHDDPIESVERVDLLIREGETGQALL